MANLLIFQRWVPVLSLRALAASSRVLKKDHPWSDYLEKLPDPIFIYSHNNDNEKFIAIYIID
jgi:hypothetical protein